MKFRTLLFVMLVGLLSVMSFTALGQDVAREDTVIFDVDGQVGGDANFDQANWMLPNSIRSRGYHQAVSEPLFILNYETGEIMPWLAESMESNDSLDVWTLNLREGAAWSDGEAFNADDVVFTIQLLLDDETGGLNNAAGLQTWVASVEKVDDLTVVFNLTKPNPRFQLDNFSVRIWGGINMLPEHVWADKDPYTFKNFDPEQGWPLGTGPYVLSSANETEWVYDLNPDWWGAATGVFKLPEPQRAIWIVTGNDSIRTALAVNNEVDSIMDVTLGAFEAMQAQNPSIVAWVDTMPFVWLDPCARQMSLQTGPENAPWDDPEMRWMLNNVIDRDEIIAIAYEGVTIPSRTMYVEYGGLFPTIDAIEDAGMAFSSSADLDAAEATLIEKGYERGGDGLWQLDGSVLGLRIQVHEGFTEKRRITADVVEQLQRFGINASADIVAGATWGDNKALGLYEATTDWDSCGSINEPWASLNKYNASWLTPVGENTSNNNHVRWQGADNDAYSAIVDEIGTLPLGDPAITDMVVEAYRYFYEALPTIPLNQATKLVPFNTTYWEGWPTAENNYNHPATWWQSTHQIFQELTKAGM